MITPDLETGKKKLSKKEKRERKKEKKKLKNKTFDLPFVRIDVSRKIWGMWFDIASVYRMWNEDPLKMFWRTRDHYRAIYGPNNVRLKLIWPPEYYDGAGKRLLK